MWEVRGQFSRPMAESSSTGLEWNAVVCKTQAEAERWWNCRVRSPASTCRVQTMFNPAGEVVKVQFN